MRATTDTNSPDKLNRIVEGTTIEGQIVSDSNIRIDGRVKGTIVAKGRLVVGPKGQIDGEVTCNNADVEGEINGQITVKELLSLKSTAKITADVVTGKLAVEPPATITGNISMGGVVKNINSATPTQEMANASAEERTA